MQCMISSLGCLFSPLCPTTPLLLTAFTGSEEHSSSWPPPGTRSRRGSRFRSLTSLLLSWPLATTRTQREGSSLAQSPQSALGGLGHWRRRVNLSGTTSNPIAGWSFIVIRRRGACPKNQSTSVVASPDALPVTLGLARCCLCR